jgi:hypothetical protein
VLATVSQLPRDVSTRKSRKATISYARSSHITAFAVYRTHERVTVRSIGRNTLQPLRSKTVGILHGLKKSKFSWTLCWIWCSWKKYDRIDKCYTGFGQLHLGHAWNCAEKGSEAANGTVLQQKDVASPAQMCNILPERTQVSATESNENTIDTLNLIQSKVKPNQWLRIHTFYHKCKITGGNKCF